MPRKMVEACVCNACGHVWLPRQDNTNPIACARCKSPYWDRPRKKNVPKVTVAQEAIDILEKPKQKKPTRSMQRSS